MRLNGGVHNGKPVSSARSAATATPTTAPTFRPRIYQISVPTGKLLAHAQIEPLPQSRPMFSGIAVVIEQLDLLPEYPITSMKSFTGSSNSCFSRSSSCASFAAFAGSAKCPSHAVAVLGEVFHQGERPFWYRHSRLDFVRGSWYANCSSSFLGTV